MEKNAIVDELFSSEIGEPFAQKLMEAARHGDLCVEGHLEGDLVQELKGNEAWFDKPIGKWGNLIYLQRNWVLETRVVHGLKRLIQNEVNPLNIGSCEGLSGKQLEAVKKGLCSNVFCLSGGPGTGKTHTVATLVRNFLSQCAGKILIAAPTGKAASELLQRIGGNAQGGTLHRLLGIKDTWDVLYGNAQLDADLIIVDECSMIDVGMWGALLSSIKKGSRLILVGDHDQLPPVEAGAVYGEICRYMQDFHPEKYVHLDICMRSESRDVLMMAKQAKQGHVFQFKKVGFEFDILKWKEKFPSSSFNEVDPVKVLEQLKEFRILSCLREGPFGVRALNEKMMGALKNEFQEGSIWPIPIIITRSNYRLGLSNGDVGVILKRSKEQVWGKEDRAFFGEKNYPALLLPEFEFAYAISVHKSQGSEYDHVLLIVPSGSENFGREILYTGITRARHSIEVYGDEEALKACLSKTSQKRSGIKRKLDNLP